jgi:hypothetical protein
VIPAPQNLQGGRQGLGPTAEQPLRGRRAAGEITPCSIAVFNCSFVLVVLGFEFKVSRVQGRHSTL